MVLAPVFGLYVWAQGAIDEDGARGAAFLALVVGNLSLALSDSAQPGERLLSRHRVIFAGIAGLALAVVLGSLLIPAAAGVFSVAAPSPGIMAAAMAVGVVSGGWFGFARHLASALSVTARRRGGRAPSPA